MTDLISPEDFKRVEIRVGTVIGAKLNKGARVPAYSLVIDFGSEIGEKKSSAQITAHYEAEELIGRQVVAVLNFPAIRIASTKSEVLVLGATPESGVVLLRPDVLVPNGSRIA